MDNNGKILIGELKGKLEQICDRIEKMENRLDELDKKIENIQKFEGKVIGVAITISFIISVIIQLITIKGG